MARNRRLISGPNFQKQSRSTHSFGGVIALCKLLSGNPSGFSAPERSQ
jgi:hypothetical protein